MFKIIDQEHLLKLFQLRPLISLFTLIILAAILIVISKKAVFNVRLLAYGALCIASAFVLSYIKLFQLPYGGTVTIASMLPLFIFALIAGPRAGIAAGLCYGMLQFIQEPVWVHWAQFLLDYPIAFAMLGLSGIFKDNIYLGAAAGSTGRLICHFLSGVIFFGSYAGDQNVFLYSFLYNISYILPDTAICLAILAIPSVKAAIYRVRRLNPV